MSLLGQHTHRQLESDLKAYERTVQKLPGIQHAASRRAFLLQLEDSIRRVNYVVVHQTRNVAPCRIDPGSEEFDPILGAALHHRRGEHDEACWLAFLAVHFGKHGRSGWQLVRDVYGGLGSRRWGWRQITRDVHGFRRWLDANESHLRSGGRGFGNHRKYVSLNANSPSGTGAAVATYVGWIGASGSHRDVIRDAATIVGNDPGDQFDHLYVSMGQTVMSFGRLACFDYLTMLGKLGLAAISPRSPYLSGAAGPLSGARLLFTGSATSDAAPSQLDGMVVSVGDALGVGMQEMEDALCNWQKQPEGYNRFRG